MSKTIPADLRGESAAMLAAIDTYVRRGDHDTARAIVAAVNESGIGHTEQHRAWMAKLIIAYLENNLFRGWQGHRPKPIPHPPSGIIEVVLNLANIRAEEHARRIMLTRAAA